MLGKVFAYELRALWKPAVVLLAVMIVAGLAGAACLGACVAVSDAAGFGGYYVTQASVASNVTVLLVLAALFCGFLVWASAVALYVFVVLRFYRTMFTDEGYLTLTLPVRTGALVMAKFLAAYLLLVVFALVALGLYSLMAFVMSSGDSEALGLVAALMGGWSTFAFDGEGVRAAFGLVNVLVSCAYAIGLAFASLTLGAWWARRHKLAAAVGIYLGVGWVLSFLLSAAGVVAMATDVGMWDVLLGAVSVFQVVLNLAIAAGGVALSAYLVRAKVDLN